MKQEMTRFIATIRTSFSAIDEVEARMVAMEFQEAIANLMDLNEDVEDGMVDVTQVIPYNLPSQIEPTEVVDQLHRTRDILIKTRISRCLDIARELDQVAWILEHRAEESFDLSGYDYVPFMDRVSELLGRKKL